MKPKSEHYWRNFTLGLLSLIVSLLGIAWWIYVSETYPGDHFDKVDHFLSLFPSLLQNPTRITLVQMAFTGVASFMFYQGLDERGFLRIMSLFMFCFSCLIGCWLLFSLM